MNWAGNCTTLSQQQGELFDALLQAGAAHGIRPIGLRAMDCMRIEKFYRNWRSDLTTEYSLLEAGMQRFCKLDDDRTFRGKEALVAESQAAPKHALVLLEVDYDRCPLHGFRTRAGGRQDHRHHHQRRVRHARAAAAWPSPMWRPSTRFRVANLQVDLLGTAARGHGVLRPDLRRCQYSTAGVTRLTGKRRALGRAACQHRPSMQ